MYSSRSQLVAHPDFTYERNELFEWSEQGVRDERQANGVKTVSGPRGGIEQNMKTVDINCCRFPIVGARGIVPLLFAGIHWIIGIS